ncbi:exosome nuclease subunit [Myotisia sp. PD_48]|nr:exosome nuclease subunit [Myotisia sp. PD_48]
MDLAAKFAPFQEQLSSSLVKKSRTTAQIQAEDLSFHRSFDPSVSKSLDTQGARLLKLTSSLLQLARSRNSNNAKTTRGYSNKKENVPLSSSTISPALHDEESIDENWNSVVDVIDGLLEKADACLDEFTGIIKKLSPSQQQQQQGNYGGGAGGSFPTVYQYRSNKISKPQLLFSSPPNNLSDGRPFKPLLKTKPHAIQPLKEAESTVSSYPNPYATEINRSSYPSFVYESAEPQMYQPFESTEAKFVDSLPEVKSMLEELKNAKEIAIDLEHHDTHSYHGLVSLMQISTRDKDWIVDTLKPWREELQMLNEVFADPNILKVLHGSNMDVIWLQRDLGLYLVGLFDTFHAARALQYPKKSLKFLLENIVNIEVDKKYQIADWRLRPLLPEMFDYARSDTHYLLYIFDHLRNELLKNSTPENNLINYVLSNSKDEALQRYERPVYDSANGIGNGGWRDALSSTSIMLTPEQLSVFRAVHEWRDRTARLEDEGPQYVLSKRALFNIATEMPTTVPALLNLATPVSNALRPQTQTLVQIIKDAKLAGATGPRLQDVIKPRPQRSHGAATPWAVSVNNSVVQRNINNAVAPRAAVSRFWGGVLHSAPGGTAAYSTSVSQQALSLSFPMPATAISVTEQTPGPMQNAGIVIPINTQESSSPAAAKQNARDKIFTLREAGGAQKRPYSTLKSHVSKTDQLEPSVDSASNTHTPTPEPKKQKSSHTEPSLPSSSKPTATGFIPVDYTSAESVLHAKPPTGPGGRAFPPKQFNPYAKSMNGPQGVRKVKKELTGRSQTFR